MLPSTATAKRHHDAAARDGLRTSAPRWETYGNDALAELHRDSAQHERAGATLG